MVLQQQVEGHDVVGANLKVNVAPSGAFVVTGRPMGDLAGRAPRQPVAVTPEQATAAAAAMFDLEPSAARETKLEVFPLADGSARWSYRVSLVLEEPCADVRAYIDAVDLSLLLSFNIASALRGRASIVRIDPLRTPALVDVGLADLGPTPADQLAGGRLVVTPGRLPAIARRRTATSAWPRPTPGSTRRTPSTTSARRCGTSAHCADGGGSRRRRSGRSGPIVRDQTSPGNAFFRPLNNDLRFGDVGPRPTARSADILYHEFSHAISDVAARLGRAPLDSESRGLSEGYSDYFANSILDDPRFAVWVAPGAARDASDPTLRFPAGFAGSEHDTGAVWAGVLWGIRSKAGARDTDRIAFESLFLLSPQSTFEDALQRPALGGWPARGERPDPQEPRRDDPGGVGEAALGLGGRVGRRETSAAAGGSAAAGESATSWSVPTSSQSSSGARSPERMR